MLTQIMDLFAMKVKYLSHTLKPGISALVYSLVHQQLHVVVFVNWGSLLYFLT